MPRERAASRDLGWPPGREPTPGHDAVGPSGVTFVADAGDGGGRLDVAIHRHIAGTHRLSRSAVQRLVADGHVEVNGQRSRRSAGRLATGDRVGVAVATPRRPRVPVPDATLALQVLHEDDDLLVVVKPAGLIAHPTARQRDGTMINALLAVAAASARPWTPHLVQRLDRGTSGVMVVAKSSAAHAAAQTALSHGDKDYLAVVWGRPRPAQGAITAPVGRDPLDRRRVVVRPHGAPAETTYSTVARSTGVRRGLTLVRCRLHTGRTHQIRVHLAHSGCPIVGDVVYGRPPRVRLLSPTLDRVARAFARPALHAWRLAFRHPADGGAVRVEAPLSADLLDLLSAAGVERALDGHSAPPFAEERERRCL